MLEKVDFSKRLREIIEQRSIRQSEICEKTGIGKSAMSQYLSGAFKPKQQNLYKLARALNVSEAWLMGYDVPMDRDSALLEDQSDFHLLVEDDSMINAHIPSGSTVLIKRGVHPQNQQIAAFMIDSVIRLRRFNEVDGHLILSSENSAYAPFIFSEKDFDNQKVKILGVAKQVIIDL